MNKIVLGLILLVGAPTLAETMRPKTVAELKITSVRIMNQEMNSGGTGSILESTEKQTTILTNKHICRLIEPGGVVDYQDKQYQVTEYQKFQGHDLCLLHIDADLKVNLVVSESLAKVSSKSIVSGHPSLLPHIATVGHLSERQDIELMVGIKRCSEADKKEDPLACTWFGGKPVVQTLDAQLISNLIKPGNSGSAVFNPKGELVGVVFAGSGRDFSYGLIVPQIYLLYFTQNAKRFPFVKVGTPVDDEGVSGRVFNFDKCKSVDFESTKISKKVKEFCKTVNDNMIWRK